MKIANAFSLNMLADADFTVKVRTMTLDEVKHTLSEGCESCVGHAETAAVISNLVGLSVPTNRATVRLERGDEMIVAQYIGPRLQEGATTLPQGATIKFFHLVIS